MAKHSDRGACRVPSPCSRSSTNRGCERALAERIDDGGIPVPKALAREFAEPEPGVLDIAPAVREGSLDRYDGLFSVRNGDGPADGPALDGTARRMEGDAR